VPEGQKRFAFNHHRVEVREKTLASGAGTLLEFKKMMVIHTSAFAGGHTG
jgi:hypothetical protein